MPNLNRIGAGSGEISVSPHQFHTTPIPRPAEAVWVNMASKSGKKGGKGVDLFFRISTPWITSICLNISHSVLIFAYITRLVIF